ncbi:MAG: mechanosensitive ion channel family protein [Spirochaetaceae bacterium]|nr:mechanosensitive ion channel family protein [Spirochaetaceae bacterium]
MIKRIICILMVALMFSAFVLSVFAQEADASVATELADDLREEVISPLEEVITPIEGVLDAADDANAEEGLNFFIRLGIVLAIVIVQILLIRWTFHLATIGKKKTRGYGARKFKPLKFKSLVLLEVPQMIGAACFLIDVIKIILAILQLIITIPLIFKFFEPTRYLADTLFGYILTPLKSFGLGFLAYIPNLFAIAIILIISRYLLRALKYVIMQIEKGKLVIHGFYPEWARPTFNIARFLIIAFTVAIIYPHLPNSDSEIFKGISVLVGVLFSLGSSSIIGNLISGFVMTYMRPFSVGDRIKLNDVTGFVLERGAMVTRIRTHKNEIVSVPNQMVMNNAITNYSSAPDMGLAGLIVHAEVTMGYDVHWQKVHEVLLTAAAKNELLEKTPPPFINQLKLDDFYCWYEINAYTKNINVLPAVYTELYKQIQNGFAAEGISMYAPHFRIQQQVDTI